MSHPLCPVPMDSVLVTYFGATLVAYSAGQEALQAGTKFYVRTNQIRPYTQKQFPLVNVWAADPANPGELTKKGGVEGAAIHFDLYVKIAAEAAQRVAGEDQNDQISLARLYYLREQVKRCITDLAGYDFGQAVGAVTLKPSPTWKLYLNEHGFPDETLVAGRLTFEASYAWKPDNSRDFVPYQQSTVNTGSWSGIWT